MENTSRFASTVRHTRITNDSIPVEELEALVGEFEAIRDWHRDQAIRVASAVHEGKWKMANECSQKLEELLEEHTDE